MDTIEQAYAQYCAGAVGLLITLGERIITAAGLDINDPIPSSIFDEHPDIDRDIIADGVAIARLYVDCAPQMYDAILNPSHFPHMHIDDVVLLARRYERKELSERRVVEIFQQAQRVAMEGGYDG